MPVRVNLPRVRYSSDNHYNNRPGFHEVRYEMVLMADRDLLSIAGVPEAVARYSSDVYYLESFVADFMHLLQDAVMDVESSSDDSHGACHSDMSGVESSSSGKLFGGAFLFYIFQKINEPFPF